MYTTCLMVYTPICQNLVWLWQREKTSCQTQIPDKNMILLLRSKVKVIQSSWMYATHRTMVIHSRAKQNMTMSKDKKSEAWTQSHFINPINLTLRSKVNIVSGSWMYLTHLLIDRPMCQIWYANVKTNRSYRHDKSL